MASLEFFELLRNKINPSEIIRQKVILTRKGSEYLGLCPFHNEKSPSFTVNDIKKFYHCFGCAAHGDVIKFVAETSGLSYSNAAIKLANDQGIPLPKVSKKAEEFYEEYHQLQNVLELACSFFQKELSSEQLNYLIQRKLSPETIKKFNLGYAPRGGKLQEFFTNKNVSPQILIKAGLIGKRENGDLYEIFQGRIIYPIKNQFSKVIAFGGRVIGDSLPKYINSPETIVFKKHEALYAEDQAIATAYKHNYMIICEGYMDVIAMHQAGFTATVASLGTAVTEDHLHKIWKISQEIIICLDGDSAGIKAASRVLKLTLPLVHTKKQISFINLPQGNDPEQILNLRGNEFFENLFKSRLSLSQMIWQQEFSKKNYSSAEDKAQLESTLEEYANLINDNILQSNFRKYFKNQLWDNIHGIRRKNTNSNILAKTPQVNHQLTDKASFEIAFGRLLIKYPILFVNSEIKNFLTQATFENQEILDFILYCSDHALEGEEINHEKIKDISEKAGFKKIFLLLSNSNNLFLDISSNKNLDPFLIWQLLLKKYHLLLLIQEYMVTTQNNPENFFEKSKIYQQEINILNEEIHQLNEIITS